MRAMIGRVVSSTLCLLLFGNGVAQAACIGSAIHAAPDPEPNWFSAVYASSPDDAWAVGERVSRSRIFRGLTEHWDGQRWNRVDSASFAFGLNSVSGISADDVWAVGSGVSRCGNGQAFAQHWDGNRWTAMSPDICASVETNFSSVAEVTTSDLWAVGSDSEEGAGGTEITHDFVVRHTGRKWTSYGMPDDPYQGGLAAVAAVSADDVWAVGNFIVDRTGSYNLIFHWNGTTWSDVRVNNPQRIGFLSALGVVSSNDVWAVGGQAGSLGGTSQPLIEHWDGSVWSVIPHGAGANGAVLTSVSAVASNDVWAAGFDPSGTHIEHWDGRTWSVLRAQTMPGMFAGLAVVPGMNAVWAVGSDPGPFLNSIATSAVFHC